MNLNLEFWISVLLPIAINYGMLRQAVKDLREDIAELKLERKQQDERIRELEIARGPHSMKNFAAKSSN